MTAVVASAGLLRDRLTLEGALRLVTGLRSRFLNAAAERLFGRSSRREVVGRGLLELFPSVVGLGIFACCAEPLRTGRPSVMRVQSFANNGVVGAFDVAAHPYVMGLW